MALGAVPILNQLRSHAASLGLFENVVGHEPVGAPQNGLTAAFWFSALRPIPRASGLASTTALMAMSCRIYKSSMAMPFDDTETELLAAADGLMTAYSGDFDLGGLVREVDLLGEFSQGLGADGGYLRLADGGDYRVVVVNIPLIISDVWAQVS